MDQRPATDKVKYFGGLSDSRTGCSKQLMLDMVRIETNPPRVTQRTVLLLLAWQINQITS